MSSLKFPSSEQVRSAADVIGTIRGRIRAAAERGAQRIPYLANEYETNIHEALCRMMPQCVLANVRLFAPSFLEEQDLGLEVDNMFHVVHEDTEYLVVVEAKNQTLEINGEQWVANYSYKMINVRVQVEGHIGALHE